METADRLEMIAARVAERGFISVGELSRLCEVSEMTIRRDLKRLEGQQRILRTFGGAAAPRQTAAEPPLAEPQVPFGQPGGLALDQVDVLVATSVNPRYDGLLLERIMKLNIPIIGESLAVQNCQTVVTVDNFQAGRDLGRWAGEYSCRRWGGRANILDLTYHLANTQTRSRGFLAGVQEAAPTARLVLSINAQSRYETAYQLTRDALTVHDQINLIFAINDITAWGAINACKDLNLDPQEILVLPFGLEGDTFRDELMASGYCKAGLAMFPEIVGPVCLEAALAAFNRRPLPPELITPYAVLTAETLTDFYLRRETGWALRWETVRERLTTPLEIDPPPPRAGLRLPRRVGFIIPFTEHEWYQNLNRTMKARARRDGFDFEIVDVVKNLEGEVDLRRRQIARVAAEQVQPGDVILVDGGPLANYLAEELSRKTSLTVITNSMEVFDLLRQTPAHTLILTGGAYRSSSRMLVGPTAEGALRELRADKLFLTVHGITFNFGLSHTNISEVTMKQAMIRSAREVILLADHTAFGQESVVQVAPLEVVHKLITDDALPASARLDLTKLGIQIILADV